MKELSTDSIFDDPSNFICPKCYTTRGRWLNDKTGNGIAIQCRSCGNEIESYRSWITEFESRRSYNLQEEQKASKRWSACPRCHYSSYRYYEETEINGTITRTDGKDVNPIYQYVEIPVVLKTSLGWLCRLCRYEWRDDGNLVSQEIIKKEALHFIKCGNKAFKEIQSLQGKTNNE